MTSPRFAPILTADDEPTAKHDMSAIAGATPRASRPSLSMVAYPAPVLPMNLACCSDNTLAGRVSRLVRRIRVAIADFVLGDIRWNEKRVTAAAETQYKLERVWDRSDGRDPAPLRAWKDSQLELERATHALLVARGKR